jgi:hypothetical protein
VRYTGGKDESFESFGRTALLRNSLRLIRVIVQQGHHDPEGDAMTRSVRTAAVLTLVIGAATSSSAQTADEIVERHLEALGGRTALGRLTSRTMSGTITLSIPDAGDLSGPFEITNAAPNRSRLLITLDLAALGAGKVVYDERFDGSTGYLIDTMQGNRDITGNQLHNLRNETFPTPLLDYRRQGASVTLGGREKIGDREAHVLVLAPQTGPPIKRYIDTESYLEIRVVATTDVPSSGPFDITMDFRDYREVDGVKVPFDVRGTSTVQNFTVAVANVTHNQPIDDAVFSRPAR